MTYICSSAISVQLLFCWAGLLMVSEQEACLLHVLMLKDPRQLNKHNTGWIVLQVAYTDLHMSWRTSEWKGFKMM